MTAKLKIRRELDVSKLDQLTVTINTQPIDFNGHVAELDLKVGRVYYVTASFVVNAKDTELTLRFIPPTGHRVKFLDYPDDDTSQVTWKRNPLNRPWFEFRRLYLEETS
ncbi:MAG: hypothetical protein SX243_22530 [Acidobacteriota bacterium]|nr:hypothetical protein [Acidobacteriota bacterium]